MAILLDADVIIRGEKGTFDLGAWAASQPETEFEVAAITVAELWHGVERARGKTRLRRQLSPKYPRSFANHSLHGANGLLTRANLGGIGILRPENWLL